MLETNTVISLAGSLVAGALIGLEREFHNRPAGLRTHTLVCLASALMMLAAVRQAEWNILLIPGATIVTDPTRMAHGILTGIGFLCAGVIFREGFSVQGLTTASSLWLTSALGLLFGVGMYPLAIMGTFVTLIVLSAFRLLYRVMPRRTSAEITVLFPRGRTFEERQLMDMFEADGLIATPVSLRVGDDGGTEYKLKVTKTGDIAPVDLTRMLDGRDGIAGYELNFHEDTL